MLIAILSDCNLPLWMRCAMALAGCLFAKPLHQTFFDRAPADEPLQDFWPRTNRDSGMDKQTHEPKLCYQHESQMEKCTFVMVTDASECRIGSFGIFAEPPKKDFLLYNCKYLRQFSKSWRLENWRAKDPAALGAPQNCHFLKYGSIN